MPGKRNRICVAIESSLDYSYKFIRVINGVLLESAKSKEIG